MANRVPVFDDEIITEICPGSTEDGKVLAADVAGQIGNVMGGAKLLESFYCFESDDQNKDFGLGDSSPAFPELPMELDFYKEQTFHVI